LCAEDIGLDDESHGMRKGRVLFTTLCIGVSPFCLVVVVTKIKVIIFLQKLVFPYSLHIWRGSHSLCHTI